MSKSSLTINKNIPILVVDHLPMVRRMVRNCLRQLGFENVHEAGDGAVAREKLDQASFSLVISDGDMPDMSPEELIAMIKGASANTDAPVLFIASATSKCLSKSHDLESQRAGVIVKPFTAQQIQEKLVTIIENS